MPRRCAHGIKKAIPTWPRSDSLVYRGWITGPTYVGGRRTILILRHYDKVWPPPRPRHKRHGRENFQTMAETSVSIMSCFRRNADALSGRHVWPRSLLGIVQMHFVKSRVTCRSKPFFSHVSLKTTTHLLLLLVFGGAETSVLMARTISDR